MLYSCLMYSVLSVAVYPGLLLVFCFAFFLMVLVLRFATLQSTLSVTTPSAALPSTLSSPPTSKTCPQFEPTGRKRPSLSASRTSSTRTEGPSSLTSQFPAGSASRLTILGSFGSRVHSCLPSSLCPTTRLLLLVSLSPLQVLLLSLVPSSSS